mmetsp:Transcript_20706/g.40081  ORF Transcript_20706/g.40081 Transcript_20706/m.40081 type:complete len:234 (-) Transcript_20706:176-877(-)
MSEGSLLLYLGSYRVEPSIVVVARHSKSDLGDTLETKCGKVLRKILQNESKKFWSFDAKNDGYTIHAYVRPKEASNLSFFIVTKSEFTKSPSVMLKDFANVFTKKFIDSQIMQAQDDGLTVASKSVFEEMEAKYGKDKLKSAQKKIDGLKGQLRDNMADLLERGDQLDEIKMNAEELDTDAEGFKKNAVALKWKFCCANAKWTAIVVISIITILTVVIVVAVCGTNPDTCKSD